MWNPSPKNAEKPVPEKPLAFLSKHQFEFLMLFCLHTLHDNPIYPVTILKIYTLSTINTCIRGYIYRVLFFYCSHPKISKYKKKTKYPNCSHPKISKYKKKTKYPNCSHPKMS